MEVVNNITVRNCKEETKNIYEHITNTINTTSQGSNKNINLKFKRNENGILEVSYDKELDEITKQALEILQKGDPLQYIINTADKFHISDKWLKYMMHCSLICGSIKDGSGIQPYLSGEKGSGKTNLADTFKHLAPENKVIKATFSNKAIYHLIKKMEEEKMLKEKNIDATISKLVFYIDDFELTKDIQNLIKRATSDFNNRTLYMTDKESFVIPAKTVWWFTKVEKFKDDQLLDRFITVTPDKSKQTTELVKQHQCELLERCSSKFEETNEVEVCRKIYEIIMSVNHIISPGNNYRNLLPVYNSRRTYPILFDIVRCITVTNFLQRKGISTDDDWKLGLEIWNNMMPASNLFPIIKTAADKIYELLDINKSGMYPTDIAKVLEIDKHNLSRDLASLTKKGLITFKPKGRNRLYLAIS